MRSPSSTGRARAGRACGLIDDPQGRLDDTFVYENALSVHPHLFRSALGQQPAIIEYQVRQTHARRDHQHRHRERPSTCDLSKGRSLKGSRRLGLTEPHVTIETVTLSVARPAAS